MKPLLLLFLVLVMTLMKISGQVTDYAAPALTAAKLNAVNYRLWVPEAAERLRGVLVLIPGRHGDGRPMAEDGEWRALAGELKLAVLACQFTDGEPFPYQDDIKQEVSDSINAALKHLAGVTQRPELAAAPLAFWGTSAGANVSVNYAKAYPDRVMAVATSKGTSGSRGLTKDNVDIPMIFAIGQNDKPEWVKDSVQSIHAGRAEKAPWTLALNPKEGHEVGASLSVVRPFLKAAVTVRLESTQPKPDGETSLKKFVLKDGWLADPETKEVAAYAEFKGKKKEAIWLPDEATALAWRDYLQ